jgi:hypothetical protein
MVCTPLVHELLLLALLWQLVISYWTWKRSQAAKHPPAQQPQRLPKILKPFAGLTPYQASVVKWTDECIAGAGWPSE